MNTEIRVGCWYWCWPLPDSFPEVVLVEATPAGDMVRLRDGTRVHVAAIAHWGMRVHEPDTLHDVPVRILERVRDAARAVTDAAWATIIAALTRITSVVLRAKSPDDRRPCPRCGSTTVPAPIEGDAPICSNATCSMVHIGPPDGALRADFGLAESIIRTGSADEWILGLRQHAQGGECEFGGEHQWCPEGHDPEGGARWCLRCGAPMLKRHRDAEESKGKP